MLSHSRAQRLFGLSNVGFTAVIRTAPYPVYHMGDLIFTGLVLDIYQLLPNVLHGLKVVEKPKDLKTDFIASETPVT